ncbi:hypothetical protein PIB30_076700 [Stylosanthes scabra]|uniref:Uncharacterized protein n=1 Tax=Stylosanthes scabra TaxID=79078 RepID=A0ABU6ZNX0_9FABA|nr:hypothetical protein [Stylosanthes scabra]
MEKEVDVNENGSRNSELGLWDSRSNMGGITIKPKTRVSIVREVENREEGEVTQRRRQPSQPAAASTVVPSQPTVASTVALSQPAATTQQPLHAASQTAATTH